MSVLSGKDPEYSKYDDMSTEALEELLRQALLQSDDDDRDMDEILYISQILVEREKEEPAGRLGDVDAAWAAFKQNRLLSDGDEPDENTETNSDASVSAPRKTKHIRPLRIAFIAAVLTILFVTAAYAVTVLGWLPLWSDEHFTFAQTEEAENTVTSLAYTDGEQSYDSMAEALAAHHAPADIVPTRIPEGYEEIEFKYVAVPNDYSMFYSAYSNGENHIRLQYTLYHPSNSTSSNSLLPKEESEPEVYTADGITHYILKNLDSYTAVWQNGDFECVFSGFATRADLIDTINSMY